VPRRSALRAGAAEGMCETSGQDLWTAMHKGAQAKGVPRKDLTEDLNNARNWLKHTNGPGDPDSYSFERYLAVEMILRAMSKIERKRWTIRMNDFADWLVTHYDDLNAS
jgi:hypothetical protein